MPKPCIRLGDDIRFLFGFPDDADRLVDIEQDFLQARSKMQSVLFALQVKDDFAPDAGCAARTAIRPELP